jgi:TetR/AcrR family transcriptional regulator, cholesterol catabolism regulator
VNDRYYEAPTGRKRGPYTPEATRAELLQLALELFSERGFQATTIQAIVEKAHVTKGAFYHHFENKEDVLRQIHFEYASQMLAGAQEISSLELPPVERLRLIIKNAVVLLTSYSAHVAVFYQEHRFLSGVQFAAIREMHQQEEAILVRTIEAAQHAGELRADVDVKLLVFTISGITAWTYQWYQPSGPYSIEAIASELAETILSGVATAPMLTAAGRLGS